MVKIVSQKQHLGIVVLDPSPVSPVSRRTRGNVQTTVGSGIDTAGKHWFAPSNQEYRRHHEETSD
jgi:hypothetical protein